MTKVNEGDYVLLHARVYKCNSEQALIEFTAMIGDTSALGPYSVRVPLSELIVRTDLERVWDEGAEATIEWMANNPSPTGVPHDPPINPYRM